MLTAEDLRQAVKRGGLVPASPIASWEGEPRAFFMCVPLHNAISVGQSSPDKGERQRWARLVADIDVFVTGGFVTKDLLKQLKPPHLEHWELRSRRPKPSLRVFCRFARPNTLVGTHVERRDRLGGMWSPEFEHEKLVCEQHWEAAGLPPQPFTAPPTYRIESYVTFNAQSFIEVPP